MAYEQQMWGKVKLPIWGPQDASPFAPADTVCTSPDHPDSSQQVINKLKLAHHAIGGRLKLGPRTNLGLFV